MSKMVGMSRNVNLEWLNKVAQLYISGKDEKCIREALNEYLSFEIKSPTNLRKTRTILMNIWVSENEDIKEAKELAIKLFKTNRSENMLLAHWCLMIISYPVFADICNVIGRIESNMFDITNREIKNKMFDLWGERSTLFHSIDKNIRTLKDIGILNDLPKGLYGVNKFIIKDNDGLLLITNTIIYLKEKLYIAIEEITNSSEFFPFEYSINLEIIEESGLFLIDKFGGELVISNK